MESSILVVDDIAANRTLLQESLEPEGYEVLLSGDGSAGLKLATRVRPDLILLDVNMPGLDGYEVCRRLKSDPVTAAIPVIFITANDDAESVLRGFGAGGVDFVSKPFKSEEVLARVRTHLQLHRLRQSLAEKNQALVQEVERRREAEAVATRANEAKSRFLSFISHEMRAPLNAIIGFSEELTDLLGPEEDGGRHEAERIRQSGRHLLELINNLLDLSKIEAGKMPFHLEEFDLVRLLREVELDMGPLVKANANELILELEGDSLQCRNDATKVKQVLFNLLSNAGKFTQAGRIVLRLAPDPAAGEVCVLVVDSGIGMTPSEVERLFQPYGQASAETSRQFGGTGLGLAISREFCRLMGGDLTVTSEKGAGSTFLMRIPTWVSDTTGMGK